MVEITPTLPSLNLGTAPTDMEQLKQMLRSGNLEAAFMLVNTSRVTSLDRGLALQLESMQKRNEQVKTLTDQLANAQKQLGNATSDSAKGYWQSEITKHKGAIDQINSDSQIATLSVQDGFSKRQQAFEMMSNLLSKFGKTNDSIVGNMR
ncbi:MAG: hypothetical protein JO339_22480 [Alphaproteobacteria bacterium]|nr:hypothetical protein [Alphaproteobacteria bacterium]